MGVGATEPRASRTSRQTVIIHEISKDFTKIPLQLKSAFTTDDGRLEIVGRGGGSFRIGTVSLVPAVHVRGMRAQGLRPVGFVTVLKHAWNLDSGWQIPGYHLGKAWRRVRADYRRSRARSAGRRSDR